MNTALANPTTAQIVSTDPIQALAQASPVVQLTLVILVGLSVFCWAIGIAKWNFFKKLKTANEPFLMRFEAASSLEALAGDLDYQAKSSSVARVFRAGYNELQKLAARESEGGLKPASLDNLDRALRKAIDLEVSVLESRLSLLATTGSTGPFIGLFGTVWGIMGSFHKIGAMGSASLAVVAPGISEALVATAIGLAAAIPAVVLYNHFVGQIRRHEIELNNFAADFLNLSKRNFFRE